LRSLSTEERLALEAATAAYQTDLESDAQAQQYLAKRGISPEAARHFRLGVVRRPAQGHEALTGRLSLPYVTPAGVVNANYRCIADHDCKAVDGHRKYLKPEGLPINLFNVRDLKAPGDAICICEGEIDTITLSACGIPAVGISGVNAWEDHFRLCFQDFTRVHAFGDADDAGKSLNKKLIEAVRAIPVRLPKGEDVNSLYLKEGPDGLRRLLGE
jgi:DNA primase